MSTPVPTNQMITVRKVGAVRKPRAKAGGGGRGSQMKSKDNAVKKMSVRDFMTYFPNVYEFVMEDLSPHLNSPQINEINIKGQVKSGKRRIVQASSLIDEKPDKSHLHLFISSFYRASPADKQQVTEHEAYLGKENVIYIARKTWRNRLYLALDKAIPDSKIKRIFLHHDENDFGTDKDNLYGEVHEKYKEHSKICFIRYSATGEEQSESDAFKAKVRAGSAVALEYNPGPNYRGARYFCENELVYQADLFFNINMDEKTLALSPQGKEIVELLNTNLHAEPWCLGKAPDGADVPFKQHICIVRLTGVGDNEADTKTLFRLVKEKIETVPELAGSKCLKYYSHSSLGRESDVILWDNPLWWCDKIPHNKPVIVFIEHACSRSTEWACQPWLAAYHTYRSKDAPFSVKEQSQGRPYMFVPYRDKGGHIWFNEMPKIRIYGDVPTAKLAGKLIGYSEFHSALSPRMKFETLKAEWGVPISGKFGPAILYFLRAHPRIHGDVSRNILKDAVLAAIDTNIASARPGSAARVLMTLQREIIQGRALASGVRRVARGGGTLENYRHDRMKSAALAKKPYGQGERSTESFQLDVCFDSFAAGSEGRWPCVDLEAGEFFVTYFLSEEQHITIYKHATGESSVYHDV